MKTAILMLVLLATTSAPPGDETSKGAQRESWVLDGQISVPGKPLSGSFALRVGLFTNLTGGQPVLQSTFDEVELHRGRFSVDLTGQHALIHRQRVFVEVAIRPAARRYADFETLSPRRPLLASSADQRQAANFYSSFHILADSAVSLEEGSTP